MVSSIESKPSLSTQPIKSWHEIQPVNMPAILMTLPIGEDVSWDKESMGGRDSDWSTHNVQIERMFDTVAKFITMESLYPSAFNLACEFHGKERVELFITRCHKTMLNHESSVQHKGRSFAVLSSRLESTTPKDLVDPRNTGFSNAEEDSLYLKFVRTMSADAALMMDRFGSPHDAYLLSRLCMQYGIEFISRYNRHKDYENIEDASQVGCLFGIHQRGIDVFENSQYIYDSLIKNDDHFEQKRKVIELGLDGGIPLELVLSIF